MRNSFPSPYTQNAAEWWINHCLNSEDGRAPAFAGDNDDKDDWKERPYCDYAIALVDSSCSLSSSSSHDGAVEEDLGQFIGAIGLKFNSTTDVHGQSAELGYWLGEEFWGRGWMTLIVKEFVGWVWRTWDVQSLPTESAPDDARRVEVLRSDDQLEGETVDVVTTKWRARGIDRLEAGVYAWNGCGSDRVLEKTGFEREGVMRGKVWKVFDGVPRRGDVVLYGIVRS
jgi:RimJ/RimL family protein N-acetyltransferase